jgi:hypothetical protein
MKVSCPISLKIWVTALFKLCWSGVSYSVSLFDMTKEEEVTWCEVGSVSRVLDTWVVELGSREGAESRALADRLTSTELLWGKMTSDHQQVANLMREFTGYFRTNFT